MTYRSYLGAGIRRTTIVPVQSQSESMDAIGLHQVSPRPMARSRAMSSTWATGTTAPGLCSTARRDTPRARIMPISMRNGHLSKWCRCCTTGAK
jgi:hypothetical protein